MKRAPLIHPAWCQCGDCHANARVRREIAQTVADARIVMPASLCLVLALWLAHKWPAFAAMVLWLGGAL